MKHLENIITLSMHVLMPISHLLSLSVCVCLFSHTQDEEAIPLELRNLPEYKELLELKRLKKQTLQEIREDKVGVRHLGYKVKILHTSVQHNNYKTTLQPSFYIYMCPPCMKGNEITS